MSGTAEDLLDVARSQIGVRETGGGSRGNRQKYSTEMDLPVTEWCAIFVSWCLREAQVPTAYASTRVTLFARHYAGVRRFFSTPRPGMLVCYDWGMNGAYDHIGIVERVLPDGRLQTIEGNTNPGNGQDGVYRMVRSRSSVRGYCWPHYRQPASPTKGSTVAATNNDRVPVNPRTGHPVTWGEWFDRTNTKVQLLILGAPKLEARIKKLEKQLADVDALRADVAALKTKK